MERYARYNKNTGDINGEVTMPPEHLPAILELEPEYGYLLLEGDHLPDLCNTHKVDIKTLEFVRFKGDPVETTIRKDDILEGIRLGKSDQELVPVIRQYLRERGIQKEVMEWVREHYKILRKKAYPPIEDYVDAQVKINTPGMEAEGQAQLEEYRAQCLAVKQRFAKHDEG